MLVGFHGYGENAEKHILELQEIPGADRWSLAAIQALHPFYLGRSAGGDIVASWMTRLDREMAIADNIEYVRRVLASIWRGSHGEATLVFAGFSQGVAMAWRAAVFAAPANGVIALAGDIPPDVLAGGVPLPPALLGRGDADDWYSAEKLEDDLSALGEGAKVTTSRFKGGHEWTDTFRSDAGRFLSQIAG